MDERRLIRLAPDDNIAVAVRGIEPGETVVLEHNQSPEPAPYWRDAAGVHHVPKRP